MIEGGKTITESTKARFNRIAPIYDGMLLIGESRFKPWRKKLLREARGRILEIGIGTGQNVLFYPPGSEVTGLDIAYGMLARARVKAERRGFPVRLAVGDVLRLPFFDDSFDTVVSTFVFCSVPDPVGGLRELRRVCKPDGRILLLEHVRIDRPVIGPLMDLLNHLTVRVAGEYINRRAVEDIGRADLTIDEIEDLGPMGIVKMMILKKPGNTEITGRN